MGRNGQKSVAEGGDVGVGGTFVKGSPHQHRHHTTIQNVVTPSRSGGRGGSDRRNDGNGGRGSPQSSQLEDLMRRKGVDEAWTALEDMQRQNIGTDKYTVSRMLLKTVGDGRVRVNTARVYRCIGIVERFIDTQPKDVDEVLFNALLDTCCRLKDLVRLESIVARMRNLKVTPSPVTLGILVKTYGQAGDLAKVLQVWDEMEKQRGQANAVTFGCMIDACVKCGNLAKAAEIFEGMRSENKHRNTILYTTLIKGYGIEKDLHTALELFREMPVEGVPYNTITYNSIIDACIKSQDLKQAEALMCEMTSPENPLEPDLITFSTLLKGYCYAGNIDKALQVAEAIKARGLRCDELVYNTLMDGCVKESDIAAGVGLFQEMVNAGLRPSASTHGILTRLYQKVGSEEVAAEAVAQLYQQHGIERPTGDRARGGYGRGNKWANQHQRSPGGHRNGEHGGQQTPSGSPMSGTPYGGTPSGYGSGHRDDGCWWGDLQAMPGYDMMGQSEPSTPLAGSYIASGLPGSSPFGLPMDALGCPMLPGFQDPTAFGGARSPDNSHGFGFCQPQMSGQAGGPPIATALGSQLLQQQHQHHQQHQQQCQQMQQQHQQPQQQQHQQQQQQQSPQHHMLPLFPFPAGPQPPGNEGSFPMPSYNSMTSPMMSPPLPVHGMSPAEFAHYSVTATAPAPGSGAGSSGAPGGVNIYPEAYFENWAAATSMAASGCQSQGPVSSM